MEKKRLSFRHSNAQTDCSYLKPTQTLRTDYPRGHFQRTFASTSGPCWLLLATLHYGPGCSAQLRSQSLLQQGRCSLFGHNQSLRHRRSLKYNQNGYFHIFPSITNKTEFKIGKRLKKEMKNISVEHDVKLHFNRLTKEFHLLIPIQCNKDKQILDKRKKVLWRLYGRPRYVINIALYKFYMWASSDNGVVVCKETLLCTKD